MLLFKHLQVQITNTIRGQLSGVNCPGVKSTPPCRILLIRGIRKLYLYGSSNYNNLNFKAVECRSKLCCIANSNTANFTKVHVRI